MPNDKTLAEEMAEHAIATEQINREKRNKAQLARVNRAKITYPYILSEIKRVAGNARHHARLHELLPPGDSNICMDTVLQLLRQDGFGVDEKRSHPGSKHGYASRYEVSWPRPAAEPEEVKSSKRKWWGWKV